MATFEERIDKAIENGGLPGIVLLAKDKSGNLNYSKVAGKCSIEPGNERPMKIDTVMRLASASKLITIVAVLQGIEKGLLSLDDDATVHLPVLAQQEVLTGFKWYGKPLTKPREQPITLRDLLVQTAGTGYDFFPEIQPLWRYRWWHKQPIAQGSTLEERLGYPLLYEPRHGWSYGSGPSWAGRMLERVAGVTLETWIQKYICAPLGLTTITFFPSRHNNVLSQMSSVTTRSKWTGKVVHVPDTHTWEEGPCMGGEGLVSSMEDYMAVLHSLLVDDEKLLKKETTAMMFTPQLAKVEKESLWQCLDNPFWMCNTILVKKEYDWGYGGVLVDGAGHKYLKPGTMLWSGLYHVLWWIDRQSGVCGIFGTQVVPGTDRVVVPLINAFMDEMYDLIRAKGGLSEEGK